MIYKENDVIVFRMIIKKLQSISAFPEDGKSFSVLRCFVGWLKFGILQVPLVLGGFGRIYQDVKEKRLFHIISEVYICNLLIMIYCIILILNCRGNYVIKFLKDFSRNKHGHPRHFHKTMEDIDKATRIMYYGVSAIIIMLCIKSYRNDVFCNTEELLNDKHYICGSIVPLWYAIEINIPMVKPLIALYIMVISLYHIPNVTCAIVLIYGSIKLIVIRIEDLKLFLKKIDFEEDSLEISRSKMVFCVDYYIEISGYVYLHLKLRYFSVSTQLNSCFQQLDFSAAIQFLAWIGVEGMVCYSGQLLEDASSSLQDQLYNIPWYNMHPPLRSIFKNFQVEVNRTLNLVIQPKLKINLLYFKKVIKGSYSLIMFLRKF